MRIFVQGRCHIAGWFIGEQMSPEEASWFESVLRPMPPAQLSPMLNVGSSTLEYRTIVCPHIEQVLLGPLRDRGVRVLHIDLKASNGVDIVGDIIDRAVRSQVTALGVKSILCNNLLEHVEDVHETCRALAEMCPPGGNLCLSVPYAFPFHPDPIDNGFRPSLMELQEILTPFGFRLVRGETLDFGSYSKFILDHPQLVPRDAYLLLVSPFSRLKRRVLLDNYRFFRRKFQVTCALFSMTESPTNGAPFDAAGLANRPRS